LTADAIRLDAGTAVQRVREGNAIDLLPRSLRQGEWHLRSTRVAGPFGVPFCGFPGEGPEIGAKNHFFMPISKGPGVQSLYGL
jgi:hypothetical protein